MWSVITGIVVGATVAIIGAVVNYLATAKRDEQRRKHELHIQEQMWEREDKVRHHENRQRAYLTFMQVTDALPQYFQNIRTEESGGGWMVELYGNPQDILTSLFKSFGEIEMFASPDVLTAAKGLRESANWAAIWSFAGRIDLGEGTFRLKDSDGLDENWLREHNLDKMKEQREDFIRIARKELGIDR